uniref:Uncharacterized protein n=1 Tax=Anopheles dirus TaxID=7168 RepID=A0A182NEG4_9DIPT
SETIAKSTLINLWFL